MEQDELIMSHVTPAYDASAIIPSQDDGSPPKAPCSTCSAGTGEVMYTYALGRIEARFPRVSLEKEFAQLTGRSDTVGKTDQQVFSEMLLQNRYIARQMCWVLSIQGLETYILQPRDPGDFDRLVEAIRPQPSPNDIDAVIGIKGPIAPPSLYNGLMLPIIGFDQIYSFGRDLLIQAIPVPDKIKPDKFKPVAETILDRIIQMTDNAGVTDEHRALNYLAMRYPAIYAKTAEKYADDFALNNIETRYSRLSGTRRIIDVIFSFSNRNTDFTEKFFTRVDVTEEFPFLVTKLSPYFDH